MGFDDRKKAMYPSGFSFPTKQEGGPQGLHEPHELSGESQFIPMDVYESDTAITAELDLPGVVIPEVGVSVMDNVLVIEGAKRDLLDVRERAEFLCSERSFGPFKRIFRLPMAVDLDAAAAFYRGGTLTIRLPKLFDRRRRARVINITRVED